MSSIWPLLSRGTVRAVPRHSAEEAGTIRPFGPGTAGAAPVLEHQRENAPPRRFPRRVAAAGKTASPDSFAPPVRLEPCRHLSAGTGARRALRECLSPAAAGPSSRQPPAPARGFSPCCGKLAIAFERIASAAPRSAKPRKYIPSENCLVAVNGDGDAEFSA